MLDSWVKEVWGFRGGWRTLRVEVRVRGVNWQGAVTGVFNILSWCEMLLLILLLLLMMFLLMMLLVLTVMLLVMLLLLLYLMKFLLILLLMLLW